MMKQVIFALGVSTLALWSYACADETESDGGGSGGGGALAETFGTSGCGTCVASQCGVEEAACASDPECALTLDCVRGCPVGADGDVDPSCESGCPAPATEAGATALEGWSTCRATGLGATCTACGPIDVPDGGVCPAPQSANACEACYEEQCCATDEACATNPACDAFLSCTDACDAPGEAEACFDQCVLAHPTGVEAALGWAGCRVTRCNDPCPYNSNACIDCWMEHCADTQFACWAHPECYPIGLCIGDCTEATNQQACVYQCLQGRSEVALELWNAKSPCINANCLTACD
jgi:hypothetical protein